ncbi:unnamed protein product [Cochlearia groenlandica]
MMDLESFEETDSIEKVSNDPPLVHDVPISDTNQDPIASTSNNMDLGTGFNDHLPVSDMNQESIVSTRSSIDLEMGSSDAPLVQDVVVSDTNQEPVAFVSSKIDLGTGSNDPLSVQDITVSDTNHDPIASTSSNMDLGTGFNHPLPDSDMNQKSIVSTRSNIDLEMGSSDAPLVQDVVVSDTNQEPVASASSKIDLGTGSNDPPSFQDITVSDMNQEFMVSTSSKMNLGILSNDPPPVSDKNQDPVAFTSSNIDFETGAVDPPPPVSDMIQESMVSKRNSMDSGTGSDDPLPVSDMNQEPMVSSSINMNLGTGSNDPLPVSDMNQKRKASTSSTIYLGTRSNKRPRVQNIPVADTNQAPMDLPKLETSISCPFSYELKPETVSLQSSVSPDPPPSLITQLRHQYSIEKLVASARRMARRKRKSPIDSTLDSGSAPSKQTEPVHHRPWLEQFVTPSPKMEEHSAMPRKKVMNKKQTCPLQASTEVHNEESNSLRSKMKESLASALALVQKESNLTPSLSSKDDNKMSYVNESYVEKTQFDEVFSSDELLQGNGLSWMLESFSDPSHLATKIETELYNLFGGVNKKYKEKGRSLLFNLKDKNNPELRESVMSGKISPERLCSMTAEELASKELSQWRQAKAEKMAEMVVLRDTDVDLRSLVRKTHKGEFQVEIEHVDSGTADVSAEITSQRSRPRAKPKSKKSSNFDKSDQDMTLPSTKDIDPMQGASIDDEMKDVGFLPPIVSLDEFMESLNSELPCVSPRHGNVVDVKEEETSAGKSDSEVESPSRSPKNQSPKEPFPKTELDNTNVASPKPVVAQVSKPEEAPSIDSKDHIWDGILQLSAASVVSVTGIFKSGEKAKTSEWPTLVEVKGRVRLSAFGKFVKELPLSRSRVLMVMNVVYKDGTSQSQKDSVFEVAKSYVSDQRVGYAEPTSGVELYLCPPRGKALESLAKIISKDHLDEAKNLDNIGGLIGVVVWRRHVAASNTSSRRKPGHKRTKSSVLPPARETKKPKVVEEVVKIQPVVTVTATDNNGGLVGHDEDQVQDDAPPGFGHVDAMKDDDDLPEFNFDSTTGPVPPPPPLPVQSRSMDQLRNLILKYGNSVAGSGGNKRQWDLDDDDDDDIPEWQPQSLSHQTQPLPPPPPRTELSPEYQTRPITRPVQAGRSGAGQQDGWRENRNDPRRQEYSVRRNRGL